MEHFFTGLALGASLIIAVGAQNAFVLSQGIRKRYHILIPLLCSLSDGILIFAGVMGLGEFLNARPLLSTLGSAGGALFLLCYGFSRLRTFATADEKLVGSGGGPDRAGKAVLITLGVTWLNPHVYIDTVLLLGSVSNGIPREGKPLFAGGALTASILWFFALSLGGSRLAPLFNKPLSWKILDIAVALIMFVIALSLIVNIFMDGSLLFSFISGPM